MTTEEYVRRYAPGGREIEAHNARFDEIVRCAKLGIPLPSGFDSVVELVTAKYIKSRFGEFKAGYLPKEGFQKNVEVMRKRFINEYRTYVLNTKIYEDNLRNGLKFSAERAFLSKNIGKITDEKIVDRLLTLFGGVFNECEERGWRKAWNEGRQKQNERFDTLLENIGNMSAEKTVDELISFIEIAVSEEKGQKLREKRSECKKAKKRPKKQTAPSIEVPDGLRTPWADFSQMRKAKNKPMTPRAEGMMFKRLMELSGGDVTLAGKILDESTRNGWTDVYALKTAEGRKQEVFTSDASYDIKAYESELVALKFSEKDD